MSENTGWRDYCCRELMPTKAGKYYTVMLFSNLSWLKHGEQGKGVR